LFKSALTVLALVLVLPYACAPVYRFADARPFAGSAIYDPYASAAPLAWKRANLHAHGRAWLGLTSAKQTDAEVAAAYLAHGYDVAVISDYQHIAPPSVSSIPAYEHGYNVGKHHQLGLGATRVAWFDLPLWQGTHQKQYVINQVAAHSALVAINHPAALQGYAYGDDELAELSGYQLIEAINGRFTTESSWDAALSAGRPVWVIGDDDTHDVTQPDRFAVAWNMIGAASSAPDAIIAALRAGRAYAVLNTSDAGTQPTVTRAEVRDGVLTVATDASDAEFTFIGQAGDVKRTVDHASEASYTIAPNDTYVRTRVKTSTHTLFLNPVVRYDGRALPAPQATIDPLATWAMRLGIFGFAALLVASIVRRHLRRGTGGTDDARPWRRVAAWMVMLACGVATSARAQEAPQPLPSTALDGTAFGSVFDARTLPLLPIADSVFSLVETMNVETISDRVSTGGLGFASAPHLSAFGSSITQTRYRLGDIDVTDPSKGGTPLFMPELNLWQRVTVGTGLMGVVDNNPGLTIGLEPRRAGKTWTTTADVSSSFGDAMTATPPMAPAIAALTGWNRGAVVASGPVSERVGLVIAGAATHESETNRGNPASLTNDLASVFANLTARTSDTDEVGVLGGVQRAMAPAAIPQMFSSTTPQLLDTSLHVQAGWTHSNPESRIPNPDGWRVFAGYTQRDRSPQSALAAAATLERLLDGPMMFAAADTGARTDRLISLGGRTSRSSGAHAFAVGADLTFARVTTEPGFSGVVGETVDGTPSRLWVFGQPPFTSRRSENTLGLFASDRITVNDHAALDLGLRFERLTASAEGANVKIGWSTFLPHAMFRSTLSEAHHIAWFVGGGISAYQLPLDTLAWGDPMAPSIDVFRWTGGPLTSISPRLLSVGPGFDARIDTNLKRPSSYDATFGVHAHPTELWTFELAGLTRWDRDLFGVVNVSPNGPKYTIVNVNDPGLDLPNPADDQVLQVANLALPSTGYQFDNVLTNIDGATARRLGAKLSIEYTGERLFVLFGAAAYEAEGRASSRGFRADENDQGLVGEDPLWPNSTTNDVGRLFGDRAFAGKVSAIYRFPADVTLGAIARYHDGQPFSRLVIVPNLNQGPDIVQAFGNGGSRFTFTATLDVRLQKTFTVDRTRISGFVDGYNLTSRHDEVEEYPVTGAAFRTPTAFQPPRTFRVGARVDF
jgi:hypothetical protein